MMLLEKEKKMKYEKLNIEITNEHYFDRIEELEDCIKLYNDDTLQFIIYNNSNVHAYESSKVYAYGKSKVDAYGNSTVCANDNSTVCAYDNSTVYARDNSKVYAYGKSKVDAYGNSTVCARDNSKVDAYEFACVYINSNEVTINTTNHFGAIIKQVHKLKKDILVYKKLRDEKIATLKLVKGQTFQSQYFDKCRTNRAIVIAISNIDNTEEYQSGVSMCNNNFVYEVGKKVIANRYDENIDECSNGIHFFLTREKAVEYEF
jgi:hypothetical protein